MTSDPTNFELDDSPQGDKKKKKELDNVYLVPFPKVVFLYPSFILAIAAGIVTIIYPPNSSIVVGMSLGFLMVLALNLVVLAFDFPRTTSLTLFFAVFAFVVSLWLLFTWKPEWAPALANILATIKPVANSTFYFIFAGILGLIFVAVLISVRFNYWEVRGNELLHHKGLMSDLVRYPTERLKIEKEIGDVFEYMLLRSGNLILTPRDARRPIVLENVLGISGKEKKLAELLSTIDVKIDTR